MFAIKKKSNLRFCVAIKMEMSSNVSEYNHFHAFNGTGTGNSLSGKHKHDPFACDDNNSLEEYCGKLLQKQQRTSTSNNGHQQVCNSNATFGKKNVGIHNACAECQG